MNKASVIGLGKMGVKLAELLLEGGYRVTVWNRTSAKANSLVQSGAVLATSVADAVQASPIVVICVDDYQVTNTLLDTPEVTSALAGKALIQFSTGSPQDARDSESWAREQGAEFLAGAILATPSQMGKSDTPIFVSGAASTFQRSEAVIKVFSGSPNYLGEPVGLASAVDLAMMSYAYGAMLGFFHGARVAEVEQFPVSSYGTMVAAVAPVVGGMLESWSSAIASENYTLSESALKINAEATARMAQTAREARINAEFPTFAANLFGKAMAEGYGDEEVASLIKVLRKTA